MRKNNSDLLALVETSWQESEQLDFKERIDLSNTRNWCEIIKDIVAMANSGGGAIIFGITDDGKYSDFCCKDLLGYDTAKISDKVFKYTNMHFHGISILKVRENLACVLIENSFPPLIFTKPGTYPIENGKQNTVFGKGTLYVRHGTKSEPACTNDLKILFDEQLDKEREKLISNISKVVKAPKDATVIVSSEVNLSQNDRSVPIRLTDDENAPRFKIGSREDLFPYRQREAIEEINKRLEGAYTVNPHDFKCINKVLTIGNERKFVCKPKFGLSPQYSEAFIDWVVSEFDKNPYFFQNLRDRYYRLTKKTQNESNHEKP